MAPPERISVLLISSTEPGTPSPVCTIRVQLIVVFRPAAFDNWPRTWRILFVAQGATLLAFPQTDLGANDLLLLSLGKTQLHFESVRCAVAVDRFSS